MSQAPISSPTLTWTTERIREQFLDFFAQRGHTRVASSSLVPGNDPTLLFTNSGMVQFKDVLIGREQRSDRRAATSQRCMRAGGKHNDLENVGYTARHHTFFEMLGNFSFGDYFKKDAIRYAWDLLTTVYGLPPNRLWVTVYAEDDEAWNIWAKDIGVPSERIVRIGDNKGAPYASDNFWQMADTGPCGPCSEVFFDHGPGVEGGPPGSETADGDRYIEIWNLVFMQFERHADGKMIPLPRPCVDTGMGLERIAAVLQQVHSNYDIDLFRTLIEAAQRVVACPDRDNPSLKVIADHIRACTFMMIDGVIPSNDGRGYVLRRIIRRALRHGHKLGQNQPFFHRLVPDLVGVMGSAYPELIPHSNAIRDMLLVEEQRFADTLQHGMKVLEEALTGSGKQIDGDTVFMLYDTYGFPADLTADVAREHHKTIDWDGYEKAMEGQRKQARAAAKFYEEKNLDYAGPTTRFHGYREWAMDSCRVLALYQQGSPVSEVTPLSEGVVVVLDATPFYAESGGQVGDCGHFIWKAGEFIVEDTRKIKNEVFGHHGRLRMGQLRVGDTVRAEINGDARQHSTWNHSATHLMNAALRKILGTHLQQKGSLVDPAHTRFDFSHSKPVTDEELRSIESLVNQNICANHEVEERVLPYDEAIKTGALALFGEKYGAEVRVLRMGDFSIEFCGGTHVRRTGDIGLFRIIAEGGIAAGIRRIEAVTADIALQQVQLRDQQLESAVRVLKTRPQELGEKLQHLQDEVRRLEKELQVLRTQQSLSVVKELRLRAKSLQGLSLLSEIVSVEGGAEELKLLVSSLASQMSQSAIVLGAVHEGKVLLMSAVTKDATPRIKAGELIQHLAEKIGGKGGGRAEWAQAGGGDPKALADAISGIPMWLDEHLGKSR